MLPPQRKLEGVTDPDVGLDIDAAAVLEVHGY
jgi:hypothetical protein